MMTRRRRRHDDEGGRRGQMLAPFPDRKVWLVCNW